MAAKQSSSKVRSSNNSSSTRTKKKKTKSKAQRSSSVAKAALIVSILTAILGAVQWLSGNREDRIAAAMEISKSYFSDERYREGKDQLHFQASPITRTEWAVAMRYLMRMNYIAFLSNNGRLNDDFLAEELKCDIAIVDQTLKNIWEAHPAVLIHASIYDDVKLFAKRHPLACASYDRQ